jgi:hypothetical protein
MENWVVSERDSRGRALKSLSDILKGKQGRLDNIYLENVSIILVVQLLLLVQN